MQRSVFVAVIACFSLQLVSGHVVEMEQSQDEVLQQVLKQLIDNKQDEKKIPLLKDFSWKPCDTPGQYVKINSLSVSPDPLKLPGKLTVSADVNVTNVVKAPLKVALEISKKEIIYIKLPCIDGYGSCTYDDICTKLSTVDCPPQLVAKGIDCRCPINPKHYAITGASFQVPVQVLSGDYKVVASVLQDTVTVACIDVQFTID